VQKETWAVGPGFFALSPIWCIDEGTCPAINQDETGVNFNLEAIVVSLCQELSHL
jgi:hypothetical protein